MTGAGIGAGAGAGARGRRGGSGRSRAARPALSRERILDAALAVIDRDGVSAFTMRRLGAELGADPMAVYHYFPNKVGVFDGIVERLWLLGDAEDRTGNVTGAGPDGADGWAGPNRQGPEGRHGRDGWAGQAAAYMRRFRSVLRQHPNAVPVVGTRPVVTTAMLDLLDRSLGRLTAAGLSATSALDLMNCLAAYTVGHVLSEIGEPVGGQGTPPENVYAALTAETHPHLVGAFTTGYDYHPDAQFERGLAAILAGWEAGSASGAG
jgi:TetR/AcrR family transcriptional regulator, tetracycline repressor protein